jgi:hypothetical protein
MLAALSTAGCVRDDESELCPPGLIEEAMIVRAYDALGNDITISDRFYDGTIMVFDADKKLTATIRIPKSDLGKERVIPLPEGLEKGDVVSIAAWGNIMANMFMLPYNMGDNMSKPFIALAPDLETPGHMLSPGDVFYGAREFTVGESDSEYDEVIVDGERIKIVHHFEIRPLNAQMAITVRGLPDAAESQDYYFRLKNQSSGYTLGGAPFPNPTAPAEIHKTGVFNSNNELVSEEPYPLIPSVDPNNTTTPNPMMVELMQPSGIDDDHDLSLVGEVTKDINDVPITLHSNRTTNVLIELDLDEQTGDTEVTVRVRITPWNEVYQWSVW